MNEAANGFCRSVGHACYGGRVLTHTTLPLPPEWLAATGLEDFVPATPSYAAGENEYADLPPPSAVLISEIRPPTRAPGVIGLVEDRTLSIMRAISAGSPLPPILLYAAPDGPFAYRLGAGFHRFTISRALGFSAIPAAILTYWEPWMTGDPMP